MYMKDKPEGFKVQPRNNNSSLKAILKNISTKEKGTSHKHTSLHTSTPNISYISDTDIPSTTEDDAVSTETDVQHERKRRKDTISNFHCTYCMKGYKTKNGVHQHVSRLSKSCKKKHQNCRFKAVWEEELEDRKKKFKCDICSIRFKSTETLRVHNHRNHRNHK